MPRGVGLLGQKIGMTQVFDSAGRAVGGTLLTAGPCVVTRVKTVATDGYDAVQVACREEPKTKRMTKAELGVFTKLNLKAHRKMAEFRPNPYKGEALPDGLSVGATLDVSLFTAGDRVDVQGLSKGRGFQGVVKRHGFSGGPDSHGSMSHRAPGSIGASTDPGHTLRGTRMGGRMGGKSSTTLNLEVLQVDTERHLVVVKGPVPGAIGTWVRVTPTVKRRIPSSRRLFAEVHDTTGGKTAVKRPAAKPA